MNEFRRDPISGRWTILATHRDQRPNQFQSRSRVSTTIDPASCPFCAGQMMTPPIVARYGSSTDSPWQVCVVPNLYPVVLADAPVGTRPDDLFEAANPVGRHEVVIESPTHETLLGNLTHEQVTLMLTAYRDRMRQMRDTGQVAYALPIKNFGPEAGASLEHCHSQIFGLPLVPALVNEELSGSLAYWDRTGRCVFCDLVEAELRIQDRLVAASGQFVAWCPYASRVNFEVWIAPRAHQARFESSPAASLEDLGGLLRQIVRMLERHPRIEAFNYLFHSLPFDTTRRDHYHWHIEIIPRTAKTAGFEWGTGVHICTIDPSEAAAELRLQT